MTEHRIDLHTHTSMSDGSLAPEEVVQLAKQRRIRMLSITDHDTIDAYATIKNRETEDLTLIPGIEFSTQWHGIGIHICGLNIDLENRDLLRGITQQNRAREDRAGEIARRLQKKLNIDDPLPAVRQIADNRNIGRPHFARHLVDIGQTPSMEVAFRKYLGNGKVGDVQDSWAGLEDITSWIRAAGGIAVLAHPLKYKLTRTRLLKLLDDFMDAGGSAMEVVNGQQDDNETGKLARICNGRELLASCGSDFHDPGLRWATLGAYSPLPESCTPVWTAWQ